jgi:transposase
MPSALSTTKRREIVERRETGESFASISRSMNVSYSAVRNIYHRFAETGRLSPAYDRCVHNDIRSDQAIYRAAVEMKRAHPSWGAGLIRVELSDQFGEENVPSVRTLQRWFQRARVQHAKQEKSPNPTVTRGKTVHEVWALDAKEQIKLADGSHVSWLTITDEASGAILSATLFPHQALDKHRPDAGEESFTDDIE